MLIVDTGRQFLCRYDVWILPVRCDDRSIRAMAVTLLANSLRIDPSLFSVFSKFESSGCVRPNSNNLLSRKTLLQFSLPWKPSYLSAKTLKKEGSEVPLPIEQQVLPSLLPTGKLIPITRKLSGRSKLSSKQLNSPLPTNAPSSKNNQYNHTLNPKNPSNRIQSKHNKLQVSPPRNSLAQ